MYSLVRRADWYFSPTGRYSKSIGLAIMLIAICMQLVFSFDAQAGGRVALVLACEKYENFEESDIDVKWAGELGQALKEHNFDVTVAGDRNDAQSRATLREFALRAIGADFALIVVGGHVVTYQSQPFFLPQNAKIQRATDLFSRALSLASIADIAGKAEVGRLAGAEHGAGHCAHRFRCRYTTGDERTAGRKRHHSLFKFGESSRVWR